ncbi:MAG: ribose 5-phosphate isomerase B, partial [Halanaerobiales bacterium]|nr:ribose 5-phosphate isomerase B [Halanaerobiales bacterium]
MKIAIGADDAALALKDEIIEFLKSKDMCINDLGPRSKEEGMLYPDIAEKVATAVARGQYERGILICGTGIGMSIVANKIGGIRAALCNDVYSAERARKSNDAQIITLGARVIGNELAKKIVEAWLL